MMQRAYPLRNVVPEGDHITRVYVEFELSRAPAPNARLVTDGDHVIRGLDAAERDRRAALPANVQLITPTSVEAADTDVRGFDLMPALVVESAGEPVAVNRLFIETANGATITVTVGEWCGTTVPTLTVTVTEPWSGTPPLFGPDEYIAAVSRGIVLDPAHPFMDGRLYFFLLDYRTHPQLQPPPTVELFSYRMAGWSKSLKSRVRNRIRRMRNGQSPVLDSFLFNSVDFDTFRTIQATLVEQCLGSVDRYDAAIRAFAGGRLRLPLDVGMQTLQPSSGAFFLFGEFAILVARITEQRDEPAAVQSFWRRMAAAGVAAQRIFCATYGAPDAARFNDYDPCGFKAPLSPDQLAAAHLDLTHATLDEIEAHAGTIAMERLAGEVSAS